MMVTNTYTSRWYNTYLIQFFRLFIKQILPPSWFRDELPIKARRNAVKGFLT